MVLELVSLVLEQQSVAAMAADIELQAEKDGRIAEAVWGVVHRNGKKKYSRRKYNWIKDYLGSGEEPPKYLTEIFRRQFAVTQTL